MKNIFVIIVGLLLMLVGANSCLAELADDEMYETGAERAEIHCGGMELETTCFLTAPDGKRLGYYDATNRESYKEIDGDFGPEGVPCLECEEEEYGPDHVVFFLDLTKGDYFVELTGREGLTPYLVSVLMRSETINDYGGFEAIGIIDKGETRRIKFNVDIDKGITNTFARIASPGSLISDIKLSRKIDWIDNDGIMTSLLRTAEAAAASIERGQSKTAENQLNALIREVKAQKRIHIKPDAALMLIEDAEYLISELDK